MIYPSLTVLLFPDALLALACSRLTQSSNFFTLWILLSTSLNFSSAVQRCKVEEHRQPPTGCKGVLAVYLALYVLSFKVC